MSEMTGPQRERPLGDQGDDSVPLELDDDRDALLRALVKRSLSADMPAPPPPHEFLRGVQKRLKQRSRGKFKAEGWTTLQSRVHYGLIAVLVLVLVVLAYVAVGPLGLGR
jgi:hypothetical protein